MIIITLSKLYKQKIEDAGTREYELLAKESLLETETK